MDTCLLMNVPFQCKQILPVSNTYCITYNDCNYSKDMYIILYKTIDLVIQLLLSTLYFIGKLAEFEI